MTIKKALSCLLVSTSIFFSSLSSASLMSEIGGVDKFIGSTNISSGDKTELSWVRNLLNDQTISLDGKYDSGKTDWSSVDGQSDVYSTQFDNSPSYFLLKFGTGKTGAASHYLFQNVGDLKFAVIDFVAMGVADIGGFKIGKISHIDEFDHVENVASAPAPVPAPAAFAFLAIALGGLGFSRKKVLL